METVETFIRNLLHLGSEQQAQIVETAVLVIALYLISHFVVWLINRRTNEHNVFHGWRRTIRYLTIIIATLAIARIWVQEFASFATYFGLLSAGLAFALSDTLSNIVGWFFIIGRRPYTIGDRIEMDGDTGDVVDIRIFQTTIAEIRNWVEADQSTGRLLHIPNQKVFKHTIANFTEGIPYIWQEVPVLITRESNWELTKTLLNDIAHRHSDTVVNIAQEQSERFKRKIAIKYGKMTPIVYTRVQPHGIELTMRFLCHTRHRRGITSAVWEDVLYAVAQHNDIQLAYPAQRLYADWLPTPPNKNQTPQS